MKTIQLFEASDGKRFDTKTECVKHDNLLVRIGVIMSVLPKRPDNIYDGWIQHDKDTVLRVKRKLIELIKPLCKGYPNIIKEIEDNPDKIHPMSFVGRIVYDSGTPIYTPWQRLMCIDDKFREHNQPYFAINGPDPKHKQLN